MSVWEVLVSAFRSALILRSHLFSGQRWLHRCWNNHRIPDRPRFRLGHWWKPPQERQTRIKSRIQKSSETRIETSNRYNTPGRENYPGHSGRQQFQTLAAARKRSSTRRNSSAEFSCEKRGRKGKKTSPQVCFFFCKVLWERWIHFLSKVSSWEEPHTAATTWKCLVTWRTEF